MTCVDIEELAAEYIDGTLARDQRAIVEQHLSVCPVCAAFLTDATEGATLLGKLPEIDPPKELVTLIAFHAPAGRTRDPLDAPPGWMSRAASRWLQPLLQPKFAMSMAMTIVSFAMLQRCTGVEVQHLQPKDFSPANVAQGVEDKAIRLRDRVVKYYENIRLVYEVETRLHQMEREREAGETERVDQRTSNRQSQAAPSNGNKSVAGQQAAPGTQETGR